MAVAATDLGGTTKAEMKDLLDRSFIPADIKPADVDMTTAGQPN